MYPLLPWRWLSSALAVLIGAAVYADDLGRLAGVVLPDRILVRLLPVLLLGLFTGFFAPTSYWAPWRIVWRWFPWLNKCFPDLNGVWVGTTRSNWPTIKAMIDSAQSEEKITEQEPHDVPEQSDAIAIRIRNSLFTLRIRAALSSTGGKSHSITAKPWRHQHSDQVHLSYVYEQQTPDRAVTDEAIHLGAADVALTTDDYSRLEGEYWTKRSWKTGRNTAGKLELVRISRMTDKQKSLGQFAREHENALSERD